VQQVDPTLERTVNRHGTRAAGTHEIEKKLVAS